MTDSSEWQKLKTWKVDSQHCESVASKLAREALLLQSSVLGGLHNGIEEAKADPVGTAARVGTAVVAGFVLSKVAGTSRCLQEISCAVNTGLTTSAVFDLAQTDKLTRIGDAIGDAWTSDANIKKDEEVLKNELGRFAFDSVLNTLAASVGTTSTSVMRLHQANQRTAHKPTAIGKITYSIGPDTCYRVTPHKNVLLSKDLTVIHESQYKAAPFTCTRTFDGKDVTRFANGDKVISDGLRTTIDTGSGRMGNKQIQINHHDIDVTINERQYQGRWMDRRTTYKDWLGVRECRNGVLGIEVKGQPPRFIDPPELSIFERLKNQVRLPNVGSPLPPRPRVTEAFGGGHKIEFANGAKLHVGDLDDSLILRNGRETHYISRSCENEAINPIDYFKRTTVERPKPE